MTSRHREPFGGSDEDARRNIMSHEWLFDGSATRCRQCGVSIDDPGAEYWCGERVPVLDAAQAFYFTFGHACNLRNCFVKVWHRDELAARQWFIARRRRAFGDENRARQRWSMTYTEAEFSRLAAEHTNWPTIEVGVTMPALAWGADA